MPTRAEYLRGYIKARRHQRRAELIEMLGGKCVRCETTEDLVFDHIDPATKRFAIGSSLSRAWAELVEEALKCQLLCPDCHREKGAEDRPEVPCGSYYKYWYWGCRCAECRAANAAKSARLRAQRLAVNGDFAVASRSTKEPSDSERAGQTGQQLPREDSNLQPAG